MTISFLAITGILLIWSCYYTRSYFNLFAVLCAPYFVIVAINQYIAAPQYGYFFISDETLIMLLEGLISFFFGSLIFGKANQHSSQISIEEKLKKYNVDLMTNIVMLIGIATLFRALYAFTSGQITNENFDDATGNLGNGIAGHLNLMALSLLPIVLVYGSKTKKVKPIVATLLILTSVATSFIKYNLISSIVAIGLFLGLNDKRSEKKSIIWIVLISVLAFIGNYVIQFLLRGTLSSVNQDFYLYHLWMYIGGSLVYDNYIFTLGIRVGVSIFEKLMTFLFALPNMFLGRIFGFRLFPHQALPHLSVGPIGHNSNVVDAIGYLYPSQGSALDIVVFCVVLFFIGALFGALVHMMLSYNESFFSTALPYFMSLFVFMSFFGTFYISSSPWELLVYCFILPRLFVRTNGGEERENSE